MKKPRHWTQPTVRVHESRDDRARTASGKTANSKVRHEPRHMAAIARDAETKQAYQATESKSLATAERSETDNSKS